MPDEIVLYEDARFRYTLRQQEGGGFRLQVYRRGIDRWYGDLEGGGVWLPQAAVERLCGLFAVDPAPLLALLAEFRENVGGVTTLPGHATDSETWADAAGALNEALRAAGVQVPE